jgi:hypothetical protein
MPRLESRGNAVVIKDNTDKTVGYFPPSVGDMMTSPYGDSTDEQRALAEGIVAQTGPRQSATGSVSTPAGTMCAVTLFIRRGTLLTNGLLVVGANGTGVTLAKVGLWSTTGALLAASSDQSANVNAGTIWRVQSFPLSVPYTVLTDGLFYAGVLQVGGTPASIIQFSATPAISGAGGALAAFPVPWGATNQADLAAFTPPLAISARVPWIGFS